MRTVVISGGGTGIGLAVAGRFAAAGERVVLLGRREAVLDAAAEKLSRSYGQSGLDGDSGLGGDSGSDGRSRVTTHALDLTDPDQVERFAAGLDGAVDVLVNNAGGVDRTDRGDGLGGVAAAWRATYDANVLTAVLLTEALKPKLADNGRIVTIGSIAGLRGAGAYGAAKAALRAFTASLATELGPRGITANLVSPGYVTETEFFGDSMSGERHDRLVAQTLVGRPGRPEDVAAAVAYLASPDAGYVTGTVLHANGGTLITT